jgi:hypothetical protein
VVFEPAVPGTRVENFDQPSRPGVGSVKLRHR